MYRLLFISFIFMVGCSDDKYKSDTGSLVVVESALSQTTSSIIETKILIEGDQPVTGNEAPKSYSWFSNLAEFENSWLNFSSDPVPHIDFATQNVALIDFGGERNSIICGNNYILDSASSELLTTTITTDNFEPIEKETLIVDFNTTLCLSAMICQDIIIPNRPFAFVSIKKTEEVIIREEVTLRFCE